MKYVIIAASYTNNNNTNYLIICKCSGFLLNQITKSLYSNCPSLFVSLYLLLSFDLKNMLPSAKEMLSRLLLFYLIINPILESNPQGGCDSTIWCATHHTISLCISRQVSFGIYLLCKKMCMFWLFCVSAADHISLFIRAHRAFVHIM